jgi:hypothetical protein
MMHDLLARVHTVLTTDDTLVSMIGDINQIGTNQRKKPDQPAIEYGYDAGSMEPGKKVIQSLRVTVYGTTSSEDVLKIADRVALVLTPANLSDATLNLHCGLCQKTRNALLPTSDFGHHAEMTFRVLFTNPHTP